MLTSMYSYAAFFVLTNSRLPTKEVLYDMTCLGVGSPIYVTPTCTACSVGQDGTVYTALECELQYPDFFEKHCSPGNSLEPVAVDIHLVKYRQNYRRKNPLEGAMYEEIYCYSTGDAVAYCKDYISGRDDCVAARVKMILSEERPDCWDYNASVKSGVRCSDKDGSESNNCVSVAYSQNAYIVACNGPPDPHCGTFLEVHEPPTDRDGNPQGMSMYWLI